MSPFEWKENTVTFKPKSDGTKPSPFTFYHSGIITELELKSFVFSHFSDAFKSETVYIHKDNSCITFIVIGMLNTIDISNDNYGVIGIAATLSHFIFNDYPVDFQFHDYKGNVLVKSGPVTKNHSEVNKLSNPFSMLFGQGKRIFMSSFLEAFLKEK